MRARGKLTRKTQKPGGKFVQLYITYIIVRRGEMGAGVAQLAPAGTHGRIGRTGRRVINRRRGQKIFLPSTAFSRVRAFDCSRETVRWVMPISSATSCWVRSRKNIK